MIPTELANVLVSTEDTLSGAVRFIGTRVPVQCLLDSLTFGRSIDDFLIGYPNVPRNQAEAVVKWQQNLARGVFGLEVAA